MVGAAKRGGPRERARCKVVFEDPRMEREIDGSRCVIVVGSSGLMDALLDSDVR
jgi:hypothetical protein